VQPRDNPHGVRDIFSRHAYDQQLGQYAEAAQGIIRIFVAPVVALYIAAIVSGAIAVELTVPEDHQSLSKLRSNLHLLLYLTMVQAAIAAGILTWDPEVAESQPNPARHRGRQRLHHHRRRARARRPTDGTDLRAAALAHHR
jgi:hypothetical protein